MTKYLLWKYFLKLLDMKAFLEEEGLLCNFLRFLIPCKNLREFEQLINSFSISSQSLIYKVKQIHFYVK